MTVPVQTPRHARRAGSSAEYRASARAEVIPGISRPKALFLTAAGLSFAMSVWLFFNGNAEQGIFVGLWVPSILSAGALLMGRE